jgi:hypothetical protein
MKMKKIIRSFLTLNFIEKLLFFWKYRFFIFKKTTKKMTEKNQTDTFSQNSTVDFQCIAFLKGSKISFGYKFCQVVFFVELCITKQKKRHQKKHQKKN